MLLWQDYHRSDVPFSVSYQEVLPISLSHFTNGDTYLDGLVKVVSTVCLHCKVVIFPFVIKNIWGRHFETADILFSLDFLLINFSIH